MKYLYLTREQTALLASALRRIADAKDTNSLHYYECVVIEYDAELTSGFRPDSLMTLEPEPAKVTVQVKQDDEVNDD